MNQKTCKIAFRFCQGMPQGIADKMCIRDRLWTKDNANGSKEGSGFDQGASKTGMAQGPDGNGAGASEGKEDSYPAAARTSEDLSLIHISWDRRRFFI